MPGPRPSVPFGNILQSFKDRVHDVYFRYHHQYGRVFGVYEILKPCLVVSDPQLIKAIMVKDAHLFVDRRPAGDVMDEMTGHGLSLLRGDDWRRVRQILSVSIVDGLDVLTTRTGSS